MRAGGGPSSFVSLLSDGGVPLEEISRLVGHRSTTVTETVYRKQIRPAVQVGAVAMNRIFPSRAVRSHAASHSTVSGNAPELRRRSR